MKRDTIPYWASTVLLALAMATGGLADLSGAMTEGLAHLGYPPILGTILGVWKLLGAAAILVPGLPRLKEWAYAGFVFNLTGATVSHLAVGDGPGGVTAPAVLLGLVAISWATRPTDRRLGELFPARDLGETVRT